jgi:hypothetical protein
MFGGRSLIAELLPHGRVVVEVVDDGAAHLLNEGVILHRCEDGKALGFVGGRVCAAGGGIQRLDAVRERLRGGGILGGFLVELFHHLGIGPVIDGVVRVEIPRHPHQLLTIAVRDGDGGRPRGIYREKCAVRV